MKHKSLVSGMACLILLLAGTNLAAGEATGHPHEMPAEDFVGVWKALHTETPDGLSTSQHGLMMVYADYVCHLSVSKEREAPTREDAEEVRLEKRARLWGQTTASCGTFKLKEGTVTVNWTTSNNPNTEGHETDFLLTREGKQIKLAPAASPQFKVVYEKVR